MKKVTVTALLCLSVVSCGQPNSESNSSQLEAGTSYLDRHFFTPSNDSESQRLRDRIDEKKRTFVAAINSGIELRRQAEQLRIAGDNDSADKLSKQANQDSADFATTIDQLRKSHEVPNPLDPCRRALNLTFVSGLNLSEMDLYKLERCSLLNRADSKNGKEARVLALINAELLAVRYGRSYITLASPGLLDIYFGPDCAEAQLAYEKINRL